MGYLLSPIDKTYDAIGLMRHLSEHNAVALTDRHEILRGGHSGRRSVGRCSNLSNSFTKSSLRQDEEKENSQATNIMVF